MNIQTATKEEILTEILLNGEFYPELNYDDLSGLDEEALKKKIQSYLEEHSEV